MSSDNLCVIIPTYNNSGTVLQVISDALRYTVHLYVVCDGTTDGTEQKVRETYGSDGRVTILSHTPNRGKGFSLMKGFRAAASDGYEYAVTMDSDGQHFADDIKAFGMAVQAVPDCVIVGDRKAGQAGQSAGSRFANRFSNFWFMLQTWQNLPDTQTGFRLYPLPSVTRLKLLTSGYEAELELLVRMAWHGTRIRTIPVKVYYPPAGERISHFRKGRDFTRISILNTLLTIAALVYGYPSMLIHKLSRKCGK